MKIKKTTALILALGLLSSVSIAQVPDSDIIDFIPSIIAATQNAKKISPGVYSGSQGINVGAINPSERALSAVKLIVSADGYVTYKEEGEMIGTAKIRGDQFSFSLPGSTMNEPGVSCTGSINYTGTVWESHAWGMILSTAIFCNNAFVKVSGSFAVTRDK